jgi:hypothetical protein
MTTTITTNHQYRLCLDWNQLTAKEQAEFDYLTEEDRLDRDFVRYRGACYDLGEFERVGHGFGGSTGNGAFLGWDGFSADSYFSAVLVKYDFDHGHRVMMGLALS